MDNPIVKWTNADGSDIALWDLGSVRTGTTSQEKTFLIWNNKGGSTEVLKMMNTAVGALDDTANMNITLVREKWVQVKSVSLNESAFTAIGADSNSGTWVQAEHSIKATGTGATAGEILGTANDGVIDTTATKNNYSEAIFRLAVPLGAVTGPISFMLAVTYEHA